MDNETAIRIAAQLRKPHGEMAKQVAEKMSAGNRFIYEYTIELMSIMPTDQLLEIGMGNGFYAKQILEKEKLIHYTGCDYSLEMVEAANLLNQQLIEENKAIFIHGEANALPFADSSFSKVFTINTLYFWSNPAHELTEIHRVLKHEGMIFIAIRPKSSMIHYPFTKHGFQLYSKDELIDLLSKNQFTICDVLQKHEPDLDLNGEIIQAETLIVSAKKRNVY